MTGSQPEYVWEFPPERRKRGRIWLIVVLAIAAVGIAIAVFFLLFRPGSPDARPQPTVSTSSPASASATPEPTGSSATPTQAPEPEPEQTAEPPAPVDPDISVFRGKVSPVLQDAERGLDIAADSDAREAAQTIDLLQQDAARLSDVPAPASITERWNSAVAAYASALQSARSAYERGAAGSSELNAARGALAELQNVAAGG